MSARSALMFPIGATNGHSNSGILAENFSAQFANTKGGAIKEDRLPPLCPNGRYCGIDFGAS